MTPIPKLPLQRFDGDLVAGHFGLRGTARAGLPESSGCRPASMRALSSARSRGKSSTCSGRQRPRSCHQLDGRALQTARFGSRVADLHGNDLACHRGLLPGRVHRQGRGRSARGRLTGLACAALAGACLASAWCRRATRSSERHQHHRAACPRDAVPAAENSESRRRRDDLRASPGLAPHFSTS
jgi:hypothetical protein